jgi:hypothetical protein
VLKIKFIAVLLGFQFSLSAQEHCAVLFNDLQGRNTFEVLSTEALTELCLRFSGDFNQPVFTYGSDDPKDWLRMSECVQRYARDMLPEGRWININQDNIPDLSISFMAGYEYTFVAFYLGNANGFTCIHTGVGEFYGRQADQSLVYVHPACCNDPSHEFYVLEETEEKWQLIDSFSVTNAYSSGFPSAQELKEASPFFLSKVEINALGNSASRVATFPPESQFRLVKEIEGDGHILHFVEVLWKGNAILLPKAFCWVELEE